MLAITNATLVMRDHVILDVVLLIENGGIDISGSKRTLNVACRNYMKHSGASIVDAFHVASYNPAKVVGLYDRGEIRKGLRADLVITDHRMNIKSVILKGEFTK